MINLFIQREADFAERQSDSKTMNLQNLRFFIKGTLLAIMTCSIIWVHYGTIQHA